MGFCLCVYLFVALTAGFSEIYVMEKKKKVHYSHSDISSCLWINVSLNWSVAFSSSSCRVLWALNLTYAQAGTRRTLTGWKPHLPFISDSFQPVALCFPTWVESFNWMRWSGRSQRSERCSFTDSRTSRLNAAFTVQHLLRRGLYQSQVQ